MQFACWHWLDHHHLPSDTPFPMLSRPSCHNFDCLQAEAAMSGSAALRISRPNPNSQSDRGEASITSQTVPHESAFMQSESDRANWAANPTACRVCLNLATKFPICHLQTTTCSDQAGHDPFCAFPDPLNRPDPHVVLIHFRKLIHPLGGHGDSHYDVAKSR